MIKLKSLLEAGFPNQLRRGFIDHSKSSAHGYAIEEVDAILKVYKEITELLTYGKFYDDKKPNKRRLDLSALVADINTAVIGQKRLGGYQNRFEAIFKKNPIKKYDLSKFQLEVSTTCRRCN